ncbi:unnamed protein product [Schistosoma margrebowiei]|uniref:Uncharacterized protein n=1 Tax=Schistosoma margrebowiei TaxID=48269 RepID=A0A183LM38_9TREM|nr:unnamed protein product [Schistosoma margrebowiei]
METSSTLRSSGKDCQHYPELMRRTTMESRAWRTADRCIPTVDWIMRTSTSERKHGIQWTARNQLDDLDFADDLALLSRTHEQIQIKIVSVAAVSASVGLNIHKRKTKVLKYNTENGNPINLDSETPEDVNSFIHLGSIIDEQGGSDADVKARIDKATAAFLQLSNIWNSKQLSTNIKVTILNTNSKTVSFKIGSVGPHNSG